MSEPVGYDVVDAVATITLNRPDAMNAGDAALRAGLLAALTRAAHDDGVRAVVLTGAGRAFCVGQDLKELLPLYDAGDPDFTPIVAGFHAVVTALAGLGKPTVAAVNGAAAGAGASLAFACDFRIVSDAASFAMAFTKIGLVPDSGASWTLQRLVGPAKALEMLLLSEPVRAEEALAIGLATRVVPADTVGAAAHEFAAALAEGPTLAYGWTKELVRDGSTSTLAESLDRELDRQTSAGRTRDHANAVKAFLAKEKPTFTGR